MRSMQVKSKTPSDGSKVLQVDSAMRMVFMPARSIISISVSRRLYGKYSR